MNTDYYRDYIIISVYRVISLGNVLLELRDTHKDVIFSLPWMLVGNVLDAGSRMTRSL